LALYKSLTYLLTSRRKSWHTAADPNGITTNRLRSAAVAEAGVGFTDKVAQPGLTTDRQMTGSGMRGTGAMAPKICVYLASRNIGPYIWYIATGKPWLEAVFLQNWRFILF